MPPRKRWVRVLVWIIVVLFFVGLALRFINILAHMALGL